MWTLFYPGRQHLPMLVIRNLVSSPGGQSANRLSLLDVSRPLESGTTRLIQGALAQAQYSTNMPTVQERTPAGGSNSSPWVETRGLLATIVK